MATTWGQFTWGSNSWASNLNVVLPSSNVITASVDSVTAFPQTGWGGKQWGVNEWGELADVTASPSGVSLTISQGDESAEGILNRGWGRKNWGEEAWGIGGSVLPTGIQIATSLASVSVTNEINVGWGGLNWGAGNWGDLANPNVAVTGQALTLSLGNESNTADANVSITGIGKTLALQGVVGGTSVDFTTGSVSLGISQTSVFAGELVVVEVTSPVNDEWGTETWGQGFWGVGDGVTVFVSGESVHIGDANVSPTGVSATGSLGTLGQASAYAFTSATATTAVNNAFGGPVIEVQVTTASATSWGQAAWGAGQWGQGEGTDIGIGGEEVAVPSVEVDVTGIALTGSIGTETVTGNANLTLSGIQLTSALGDEDAFTNVRVNVTGQALGPIVIGDYLAGISINVSPTGVTGTTNTGTIGLNAWAVVDPGASPTWTVVDKAA